MDLQLFAREWEIGTGEEDDTPDFEDKKQQPVEEEEEEVEDTGEDLDFGKLFGAEEETDEEEATEEEADEEPAEEEEETEDAEKEEEETEEAEDEPKYYTEEEVNQLIQQEINRVLPQRLSREQAKYSEVMDHVKRLEDAAGMKIGEIIDQVLENRAQHYMDEYGMPEEEARKYVQDELRLKEIEEKQKQTEEYMQRISRQQQYNSQKQQIINSNPLLKKYEQEIDAFSGNGELTDFETAANYILGEKIRKGELLDEIRTGAEKKVLANSKKRGKARVASGREAPAKSEPQLNGLERAFASALGVPEKEWLAEKKRRPRRR